jgi:hypothetical protein
LRHFHTACRAVEGFKYQRIFAASPPCIRGKILANPSGRIKNLYSQLKTPFCRGLFHQPLWGFVATHKALPQNRAGASEEIPRQFGASRL